jgi:hypothetical protein
MSEPPVPIPEGLVRCPTCRELRGTGLHRVPPKRSELKLVTVACLCEGGRCKQCGNRTHRPISNYYDEKTGHVWHVAHFAWLAPCTRCGAVSWQLAE